MTDESQAQSTPHGESTQSVHGGREKSSGPVAPPLVRSSTFAFADHEAMQAAFRAKSRGVVYSRYNNPTFEVCERRLAALENAEAAWIFSSGMAAITAAVLSQVQAGDRVLVQREIYGGAYEFFRDFAPRLGLEVDWFTLADRPSLERALARRPALVYVETPTNPHLRCLDLAEAAVRIRAAGATSVCDSTFGSPVNQQPLRLGMDLVVHSATKYLAGHADLVAGCVLGDRARLESVWRFRKILGGSPDPATAYLLERSLRTLSLRMTRHNENGLAVAGALDHAPGVQRVHYPGLPAHPDHAVARRQMRGFGGMVTVELDADLDATIRFVESLRLFWLAPSLGGVESLVSIPATSSHYAMTAAERAEAGIPDGMVRLSLGIEDAQDLVADVRQALARALPGRKTATIAVETQ